MASWGDADMSVREGLSAPELPADEAHEPACEPCQECVFDCAVPGLDVCYACLADLGGEAGT